MRNVIAVLVFIAFLLLAIYTGVWVMFIGGIVGLIEAIRATNLVAFDIAINIAKILFSGFVGYFIFYIGAILAGLASGQFFKGFRKRKRR